MVEYLYLTRKEGIKMEDINLSIIKELESKKFSKKITLAHSFMVFLSSQH